MEKFDELKQIKTPFAPMQTIDDFKKSVKGNEKSSIEIDLKILALKTAADLKPSSSYNQTGNVLNSGDNYNVIAKAKEIYNWLIE